MSPPQAVRTATRPAVIDAAPDAAYRRADSPVRHRHLLAIYRTRGLPPYLAEDMVGRLSRIDALGARLHDELRVSDALSARAPTYGLAAGAVVLLSVAVLAPLPQLGWWLIGTSVLLLASLGGLALRDGGIRCLDGAGRIAVWGASAMAVAAAAGAAVVGA